MKKLLISLALTGLTFVSQGAYLKSYSFLDPNVSAFFVTNGIGATNLESMIQFTNAASATNYSLSTGACFMYTNGQPWYDSAQSNYFVLGGLSQTQYGVWFPGSLRIDVLSNITAAAGVFGVAPLNHTNQGIVVTNDMQNMFADVPLEEFYPPFTEIFPVSAGTGGTNCLGIFSGTMLAMPTDGAGNSNYVTFAFVPVITDPPAQGSPPLSFVWNVLGSTKGLEVSSYLSTAGSGFASGYNLQPFTISFTNSGSTYGRIPQTFAVEIPMNLVYPAKYLRIRSATPGTAAASGLSGLWISNLKFTGLSQYGGAGR